MGQIQNFVAESKAGVFGLFTLHLRFGSDVDVMMIGKITISQLPLFAAISVGNGGVDPTPFNPSPSSLLSDPARH